MDRTYAVNDVCVSSYALERLDTLVLNGIDDPSRTPVTKSDGSIYCETFNAAGYLGAMGLENTKAPPGFPVSCYSKALVPFSYHALGIVDPYSKPGTFFVNKSCVSYLRSLYVAAVSTCVV